MAPGGVVPSHRIHRDQSEPVGKTGGAFLQSAGDGGAVDQGRQECHKVDTASFDIIPVPNDPHASSMNSPVVIIYHKDPNSCCKNIKIFQTKSLDGGQPEADDHFNGKPAPDSPFYPQQDSQKNGDRSIYDRPGLDSPSLLQQLLGHFTQTFTTCAYCMDTGMVLNCVKWSHSYDFFNGDRTSGMGMGQGGMIPPSPDHSYTLQ
jgi:hypothetical protein